MFKIIGDIGSAIGNAVSGILDGVDKISTTKEEKMELRAKMLGIQASLELELAKLGSELAKEQAGVIKSEITSKHGIAATWRPILMLSFGAVILYSAVIGPIFGLPPADMSQIPDRFWGLVTLGVGGYVGGRTIEKIAPTIADAYKNRTE